LSGVEAVQSFWQAPLPREIEGRELAGAPRPDRTAVDQVAGAFEPGVLEDAMVLGLNDDGEERCASEARHAAPPRPSTSSEATGRTPAEAQLRAST